MSLIVNALDTSLREHSLVGIHTDARDISKYSLGWVTGLSNECYCLNSVDEFGAPDSIHIGLIDNICRVSRGGEYIERIEQLTSMNPSFAAFNLEVDVESLSTALQELAEQERVITIINAYRLETTGRIVCQNRVEVELQTFDNLGRYEGDEILKVEEIFRIECYSASHRGIELMLSQSTLNRPNSEGERMQ